MNPLLQIEIPRRSVSCFKGGERLLPGMEYYSFLMQDENQKFIRRDFCLACWQQFMKEVDVKQGHGYWKSRIENKKESSSSSGQSKTAKALILFKTLLQEVNRNEAEIFILALLLARARRLILRRELEQEGQLYALYEVAHQETFFMIKKIEVSQLETAVIQQSLAKKLNTF